MVTLTKNLMNEIIDTLDRIAKEVDPLEYKLPVANEPVRAQMREAIREIFTKQELFDDTDIEVKI